MPLEEDFGRASLKTSVLVFSEDIATDVTVQIGDAREELDVLDKFGNNCFARRFVFSAALLNRRDEVMHLKIQSPRQQP